MKTKIIAHRGFRSQYPENTLTAFRKALEIGAHGLELDVHYSKDGEIVVFHDFELERITGQSGHIFDFTYETLKDMPIHLFGITERIPRLEEVLSLFLEYEKNFPQTKPRILNVEFKAGSQFYKDIEKRTLDLCLDYLTRENLIFSSFDHKALLTLKEIDSTIKTGALTSAALIDPWLYLEHIKADYYHPHYLTLTESALHDLLEHDVEINTYTLNSPDMAKQFVRSNIHAIITDEPEELLKLLETLSKEEEAL